MSRKVFLAYWARCSALVAVPFGYLATGAHSVSSLALVVFGFLGRVSLFYSTQVGDFTEGRKAGDRDSRRAIIQTFAHASGRPGPRRARTRRQWGQCRVRGAASSRL